MMSALSLACTLSILSIVALALIAYLTFNIKGLETRLDAVSSRVNDHTVLITINSNKLTRLESLVIGNSAKLSQLIERERKCHEMHLKPP